MHVAAQMNKPDVGVCLMVYVKMVRLLHTYHPDLTIHDAYGLKAIHYCAYENVWVESTLLK